MTSKDLTIPGLNDVNLDILFSNIDKIVKHNGMSWHYKKSQSRDYGVYADKFDRYFTEKIKLYSKSLQSENSIIAGMSVRGAVEPHKKNKFILSLDIKRYYESIHFDRIHKHLLRLDVDSLLIEKIKIFYFTESGYLKRGLRASAFLSDLVGIEIDKIVKKIMYEKSVHKRVEYTRYYDDLLFSADTRDELRVIEKSIGDQINNKLGLSLNSNKAKLRAVQGSSILGLRIVDSKFIVSKKYKKILRARLHRIEAYSKIVNWESKEDLIEYKRAAGRIVGSMWHAINNSEQDAAFYKENVDIYNDIMSSCDDAMKELINEEEEPFFL